MKDEGDDGIGRDDRDLPPDPFSCGLITFLLLAGVVAWLMFVYVLSRGW